MPIDCTRYAKLKSKNMHSLVKVGDDLVVAALKKFDTDSGEPHPPELQQTTIKEIDDHIAQVQKVLDELNDLRADAVAVLGK